MYGKKWSIDELETLRNNSTLPKEELYNLLPKRSAHAIDCKMCELGLNADRHTEKRPWSNQELDILTNNLHLSNEELQDLLPRRSKSAIAYMRNTLGFSYNQRKKYKSWTKEEDDILIKKYHVGISVIQKYLPDRLYNDVRKRIKQLKSTNLITENRPSMKNANRWTPHDEDILKRFYPIEYFACRYRLDDKRTDGAISSKANKLNIKVSPEAKRQYYKNIENSTYVDLSAKLTNDEMSLIKEFYKEGYNIEEIQELYPDKDPEMIQNIVGIFKSSLTIGWTIQEDALLRAYYPSSTWKYILELIPNKRKSDIIERANELNIRRKNENTHVIIII